MMDKFFTMFLAVLVAVLSFATTALAANAAAPVEGSILELAKPVFDAVMAGDGWLAAAMALVFAVTAARRYGASRFPILNSKVGGVAMNLLLSFGGAASTALLAGAAPSFALAWTALKVSFTAAVGFEFVKELLGPAMRWLEAKAPTWMRPVLKPVFDLILWAFEGRKAAIAKAEAAGQAAVDANPPTGVAGVVGTPERFP